jgi:Zn-dependent protease
MFKTWRLGALAGFPVEISLSFLLLLGAVFLWFGGIGGVAGVLLVFGSVLLHELGHALVARRLGVPVSSIELNLFGGAAKMTDLPRTAGHEIAIAAAGPAVSLVLAGAGFGLGVALGSELLLWLGGANALIAGFNLIPALPMDGGRILRALLTRKLDYVRATDLAVGVSRVTAIAFAIAGVMGSIQLLLLAPFLWLLGSQEKRVARQVAHRYSYDRAGYAQRGWGEPEVLARDGSRPWSGGAPRRHFVIRERGGRLVVEVV